MGKLRDLIDGKLGKTEISLDTLLEGKKDEEKDDSTKPVTYGEAIGLSSVYSNVELISNIIAGLEVKLYKEVGETVEEVKGDIRTTLLNDDTGNLMTGDELKKAMVRDYIMYGIAYVYKHGVGKYTKSLHYLPNKDISVLMDHDPIFRSAKLRVREKEFYPNDFIIVTKNTENGVEGKGLLIEANSTLKQALDNQKYNSNVVGTGGVRRGVLQSTRRLTQSAIDELKKAWKKLNSGNNDCIVLNEGITYKELQQTSSELEMNDSNKAIDANIDKMLNVPSNLYSSNIPDKVWSLLVKAAVMPIISKIEKSLNKSLLSLNEKGTFYFAFDTKKLDRGDIEKRYKAYEIALKNSFMTPDEVRFEEDFNKKDNLDFVKFNLGDVLMNVATGEIYTPNMNTTVDSNNTSNTVDDSTLKGGDK